MTSKPERFLVSLVCALCLCWSCGAQDTPTQDEPRCAGPFEKNLQAILRLQGASKTYSYLPNSEVLDQLSRYPDSICPRVAMARAIVALVNHDAVESLGAVGRERGDPACGPLCLIGRRSSLFGIVADRNSPLRNQLLPIAPNLQSVEAHWVFFLSVSELSEHGYWALVARDGSGVEVVSTN